MALALLVATAVAVVPVLVAVAVLVVTVFDLEALLVVLVVRLLLAVVEVTVVDGGEVVSVLEEVSVVVDESVELELDAAPPPVMVKGNEYWNVVGSESRLISMP